MAKLTEDGLIDLESFEAGEALSAYQPVYLASDGKIYKMSYTSAGIYVGLTTEAVAPGDATILQMSGLITNVAWSWGTGNVMVGNTAGTLWQSVAGYFTDTVQIVGLAISSTSILLSEFPPIRRGPFDRDFERGFLALDDDGRLINSQLGPTLLGIEDVMPAAGRVPYFFDGSGLASTFDSTAFGRSLANAADAAALRVLMGAVDDPITGAITTTDATVTNIASLAPANNTLTTIDGIVQGYRSSGAGTGAAWRLSGTAMNDAGTVTLIGSLATVIGDGSAGAWAAPLVDVNGANIRVRVRGAVSHSVTWKFTGRVTVH